VDYPSVLFTFLCTTRASILSLFEQGFDLLIGQRIDCFLERDKESQCGNWPT